MGFGILELQDLCKSLTSNFKLLTRNAFFGSLTRLCRTLNFTSCILLKAKFRSTRGASCHPAFMDSSLTVSLTRLPCPPCGKMGQQSWTVVVAINQLPNLDLDRSWQYGGYIVDLLLLKSRFDTAEMSKLFRLTATAVVCTNDGGDYEVMYRRRPLTLAKWKVLRM